MNLMKFNKFLVMLIPCSFQILNFIKNKIQQFLRVAVMMVHLKFLISNNNKVYMNNNSPQKS